MYNINSFCFWIRILLLIRIWFSRSSSSPIYSGTGFAIPITWGSSFGGCCQTSSTVVGDEEPQENQILTRKIILIQFQKLFTMLHAVISICS